MHPMISGPMDRVEQHVNGNSGERATVEDARVLRAYIENLERAAGAWGGGVHGRPPSPAELRAILRDASEAAWRDPEVDDDGDPLDTDDIQDEE